MNVALNDVVRFGIDCALTLIQTRHENASDPDNALSFHNARHTVGVLRRTGMLLRAMGASERECQLGTLAAAFHDTVQLWEANPTCDGRVLRRRFAGQNEADSAAEAIFLMHRMGQDERDERDSDLVRRAILATVPGWDVENRTVSQPNLPPDASPVVLAVALADLGIPGMEGAANVEVGDQLFREENLDVSRELRRCTRRCDLSDAVLQGFKARILAWCRNQAAYVRGRRARLPIELGELSGERRAAVEAMFGRFDEAIAAADEVVRVREALPAWEVLRLTGYSIPGLAVR